MRQLLRLSQNKRIASVEKGIDSSRQVKNCQFSPGSPLKTQKPCEEDRSTCVAGVAPSRDVHRSTAGPCVVPTAPRSCRRLSRVPDGAAPPPMARAAARRDPPARWMSLLGPAQSCDLDSRGPRDVDDQRSLLRRSPRVGVNSSERGTDTSRSTTTIHCHGGDTLSEGRSSLFDSGARAQRDFGRQGGGPPREGLQRAMNLREPWRQEIAVGDAHHPSVHPVRESRGARSSDRRHLGAESSKVATIFYQCRRECRRPAGGQSPESPESAVSTYC